MNNSEVGSFGEKIATNVLLKKGYLILFRNHREKFDEIDIVARSPEGILTMCEVKTVTEKEDFRDGFKAEDHLTGQKLKRMTRASRVFTSKHPELIWESRGWQMDLIAVTLKKNNVITVRHYKNIP
jgi:putative endonuclease